MQSYNNNGKTFEQELESSFGVSMAEKELQLKNSQIQRKEQQKQLIYSENNEGNYFSAAGDDSLKYGVSAKIDLYTHQALTEYANQHNNGVISNAVRDAIMEMVSNAAKDGKLSAKGRIAIKRQKRKEAEKMLAQLKVDYISLQNNYDADFEQDLIELAADYGLQYPPDTFGIELWQVNDNLMKVYNSVKKLSNGREGVTLREVYRDCGYSQQHTMNCLRDLRESRKVRFEEVATGQQVIIYLMESINP